MIDNLKNKVAKNIATKVLTIALGSFGLIGGLATDMVLQYNQNERRNNIIEAESRTTKILNITYYLEETKLFLNTADNIETIKEHLKNAGFIIDNDISIENIVKDLQSKFSIRKKKIEEIVNQSKENIKETSNEEIK